MSSERWTTHVAAELFIFQDNDILMSSSRAPSFYSEKEEEEIPSRLISSLISILRRSRKATAEAQVAEIFVCTTYTTTIY